MHSGSISLSHGCLLLAFQAVLAARSPPLEVAKENAELWRTVEVGAGKGRYPLSLLQIAKDKAHHHHSHTTAFKHHSLSRTVVFEPEKWNDVLPVRKSHNCYEYALNDVDNVAVNRCRKLIQKSGDVSMKNYKKCRRYFHIPGYHWHQRGLHEAVRFNRTSITCHNMLQRIALDGTGVLQWAGPDGKPTKDVDNRGVKSWKHGDSCPNDYYMASVVIRPHARFHFYRRDHPCEDKENKGKLCWTHKPGILNATRLDASNKEIPDLHAANRGYGKHAYTDVCGFFCVPGNNFAATHSDFFRGSKSNVQWATV